MNKATNIITRREALRIGVGTAVTTIVLGVLALTSSASGSEQPNTSTTKGGPIDIKTIYVSPQGTDSAAGSLEYPVASVRKAMEIAGETIRRDGVRIVLRDGLYELAETLVIDPSGPMPLTIKAYPGKRPVLSGGVKLPNTWRLEQIGGKEVWTQVLPDVAAGKWYFRQLWVNGQPPAFRPYPDRDSSRLTTWLSPRRTRIGRTWKYAPLDRFVYKAGDFNPDWSHLGDIWVMASHHWFHEYFKINNIDDKAHIVRFTTKAAVLPLVAAHPVHGKRVEENHPTGHDPKTFYEPAHYRINNVFEALSEPGEFYLDRQSGKLY